MVKRIEQVVEVWDLEVLKHPRRPPAAGRYRDRPVRDTGCPEQPACRDAGVEVVDLVGADRPLEDVQSKETERRVEVPPVERDVLPGDEPVVNVEAQAGVVTSTDAVDVANADEAVEIGDRVRLAGAGEEYVEHLGARAERLDPAGDMPRGAGRPRRQRRTRPEHLPTEEPGGAQPSPGGEKLAAARPVPVARLKRADHDG